MKNSKEYGDKLKKWIRSCKRSAEAAEPAVYQDPLEALIYGIISEHRSEPEGKKIWKRIRSHFVDFNDLRVCRNEEIFEVLEDHGSQAAQTAALLTGMLNQVYDKYDCMSLAALKELGKRQGRKELEEIGGISRYAADYCFLTALGGHAIPLTETMKNLLRREEMIHPESPDEEIAGFLERQVSAADGWAAYCLLRAASEGRLKETDAGEKDPAKDTKRKKTVRKKAVSKKTAKRKTVRKK